MVHYRSMAVGEELEALALVMRSFDRFVRPDFSEQGVSDFAQSVRSFLLGDMPGHVVSVAESDGRLVGVIDVRDTQHICLFFVEPDGVGRGIGGGLLDYAISRARSVNPTLASLTVNSSPWAVPAYRALAFTQTGEECEENGIRCGPMERQLGG